MVLQLVVTLVASFPYFQNKIPNGDSVPHPCKPNYLFHGVGHINPKGGGDRNPFGIAFKDAGMVSVCDPWDSVECKDKNKWIDCDPENDFKCDAFNEVGVRNVTIRFPTTRVPPDETTYYCMIFDLPQDGDFHLVGTTPHIDNKYVMHHIILTGCDESEGPVTAPKNQPELCGMGNSKCNSVIGLWAVGFDGECFHKDVGMRIGSNGFKTGMLQFHWNNPEFRSDYVDSSGINLFYTANRRPFDASVIMIGQTYLHIPPQQDRVEIAGLCSGECTQRQMTGSVQITRALNHMHYLGREMKIEHYRQGVKIRDITNDEVYSYDSPVTYTFPEAIEFLPGDELKTTCVYKSKNKIKTTFYGDGTSEEMCFGFLTYHPKQSWQTQFCSSWKGLPACKIWSNAGDFPVIDNCKWHTLFNVSHPYSKDLYNGVSQNCVPFGPCTPECLEEVKRIQNHPCIKSDMGDYLKYTGTIRQDMQSIRFYAGIDSCSAALALQNQAPCDCRNCPNGGVNSSGYVQLSFMLIAVVMIFFYSIMCRILILLCLDFIFPTAGYPYLQDQIPNGQSVPHPCNPNFIFHGVGHTNPKGGGDRNPFGIAFKEAGLNWKTVCPLDSDGDGRTNGEELGDPECKWKNGEIPDRTEKITHPGMMNKTIRFPETQVPPTQTNYYCMTFDLPNDGDFHLVGTTPHIDNKYVMHHILIFGCEESADPVSADYNTPLPCGMGNGNCNRILGGWSVGNDGDCYHRDVGIRIGTNGYRTGMLQFHWNNPELRSDYVDSSGVTLFYTANRRRYDAGVLTTGQTFLEIPPRMDRVDVFGTCSGECSRKQMKGPVKFTRASNHMHYLGNNVVVYNNIALNLIKICSFFSI
ncbi:hypothetical protein KUTeg_022340 [Tegillarca granosa]|uniref:Uncharacterized protein n=1 Tax=Tegillarca granosa TaxID=220873 RepID=A0ABQ9EAI6_TEGGR|nr:hypothetical protein KUTeg_022340 [Tegillarca granosa]